MVNWSGCKLLQVTAIKHTATTNVFMRHLIFSYIYIMTMQWDLCTIRKCSDHLRSVICFVLNRLTVQETVQEKRSKTRQKNTACINNLSLPRGKTFVSLRGRTFGCHAHCKTCNCLSCSSPWPTPFANSAKSTLVISKLKGLWNTSRYSYFDISVFFQNWGKYKSHNQISQMNM